MSFTGVVEMRYVEYFLTIVLLLFLLINGGVNVLAVNTGFSTEELTDKDTFVKNVDVCVLDSAPEKKAIVCFDVNESGMIAIGHNGSDTKIISIYNLDGGFLYGYEFNCTGDFGVEWDNENLIIYFVRSDVALEINSTGEIESVLKIKDTIENNSYWNKQVFSTKRTINDKEYLLKNDMGFLNLFASSYSQLIITDSNGQTNVFYDVNSEQLTKTLIIFIGVLLFVGIVVYNAIRQIRNGSVHTN